MFTHLAQNANIHQHNTVAEARECEGELEEAAAEVWAEGAWLRAAEYDPQAQDELDRDRQIAALGYGPPN